MGAVKSIPVVGEVVTAADVIAKAGTALVVAPFSDKKAKQIMNSAEKSIEDYSERSPVAATIKTIGMVANDEDDEEIEEVWKKVGSSYVELADGVPVVGHVKGVVHYIAGDREKGDHCMKAASRSAAVVAATVATAGMGAPLMAASAVAAGVAMDEVTTVCDSLVHQELRPNGHFASIVKAIESSDAGDYADAALGFTFECGTAYAGAHFADKLAQKQNTTRVYRTLNSEEATLAVSERTLPRGYGAGEAPLGETWISESVEHPKSYLPKQRLKVPDGVQLEAVQLNVDKSAYSNMKRHNCIPQTGSRQINNGGGPIHNVWNVEREQC